jgi:FeS assembly SUF system regulator
MFRINKLTDYAVVLLVDMARQEERAPGTHRPAPQIAQDTGVPLPTVAKVMKLLGKDGLVVATRGAAGGYGLGRRPAEITVAHMIQAVEGPIALTSCVETSEDDICGIESLCPMQGHWNRVNAAVHDALSGVTLAEMAADAPGAAFLGAVTTAAQ